MLGSAGEYLLVVLGAWSVATVGMNAFFLDSLVEQYGWWGRSLLALGATVALVLALYATTRNRRQLAGGVVIYVAILAIFATLAIAMSNGESPFADVEGNYLYLFFVISACATGCFMLTRTLPGCAIWLVASSLTCSIVQAFYRTDEYAMSLVAVLAALALVVHKNFRLGLEKADSAKAPSHGRNFTASVLPALAVGGAALVLWFGVIAPLDPGAAKITLTTDYRRLPVEQLKGVAEEKPVLDYSMTTDNLVDGFRYTTDDLVEDPTSSTTIDAKAMLEQNVRQQAGGEGAGAGESAGSGGQSGGAAVQAPNPESPEDTWDEISWTEHPSPAIPILVALLALVLAAIAYFVGRRVARRRRLEALLSQPPREAAQQIYLFLLGRFSRIGFKRAPGATLAEFSKSCARQMDMYALESGVAFADLTRIYQECAYGQEEPTEDDLVPLVAGYLGFWRGARMHLGNLKYFFKSFRL